MINSELPLTSKFSLIMTDCVPRTSKVELGLTITGPKGGEVTSDPIDKFLHPTYLYPFIV